jgi:hypothetical protein
MLDSKLITEVDAAEKFSVELNGDETRGEI